MKVSAKGRYALAAILDIAQQFDSGEYITVLSISERLGISKIYLEQVFSLLKRGGLVVSVKGAQGGYQLSRKPGQITVMDVLSAVELSLFEQTNETVLEKAPEIEAALRLSVFDVLDKSLKDTLSAITLIDILNEVERHKHEHTMMFYI